MPPAIAGWLAQQFGGEAITLDAVSLRQAGDLEIFEYARKAGYVIMTKDDDFVDLVTRLGPPPQVLWVTCGNVTSAALRDLLVAAFPAALEHLQAGEPVVEIARAR